MFELKTLARDLALAAILATGGLAAAPVAAAPADVALLKEYLGSWKGRGTMTGANTETVVCRLELSEGNQDKVNYSGRCTMAGTNVTITGTLAYIEQNRRYEAIMTSNATFQGTAVGRKQGNGIVFNLRESGEDEEGNPMTITAGIALQGGRINVDFNILFNETGDSMRAQVPFSK